MFSTLDNPQNISKMGKWWGSICWLFSCLLYSRRDYEEDERPHYDAFKICDDEEAHNYDALETCDEKESEFGCLIYGEDESPYTEKEFHDETYTKVDFHQTYTKIEFHNETCTEKEFPHETYAEIESHNDTYTEKEFPHETYAKIESHYDTCTEKEFPHETCAEIESHYDTYTEKESHDDAYAKIESHNDTHTEKESHDDAYAKIESHNDTYTEKESHDDAYAKIESHNDTHTEIESHDDTYTEIGSHNDTYTKIKSHNDTHTKIEFHNDKELQNTCRNLGEVCVALKYEPDVGKLTLDILAATKLKEMDGFQRSYPYVKIGLYRENKRIMKKKTSTKKSTPNLVYNESFTFKVPRKKIEKVSLMITAINYGRYHPSEIIGHFVLGSSSQGKLQTQWRAMLRKNGKYIVRWHALQKGTTK